MHVRSSTMPVRSGWVAAVLWLAFVAATLMISETEAATSGGGTLEELGLNGGTPPGLINGAVEDNSPEVGVFPKAKQAAQASELDEDELGEEDDASLSGGSGRRGGGGLSSAGSFTMSGSNRAGNSEDDMMAQSELAESIEAHSALVEENTKVSLGEAASTKDRRGAVEKAQKATSKASKAVKTVWYKGSKKTPFPFKGQAAGKAVLIPEAKNKLSPIAGGQPKNPRKPKFRPGVRSNVEFTRDGGDPSKDNSCINAALFQGWQVDPSCKIHQCSPLFVPEPNKVRKGTGFGYGPQKNGNRLFIEKPQGLHDCHERPEGPIHRHVQSDRRQRQEDWQGHLLYCSRWELAEDRWPDR
jgi:hypothetical protein